MALALPIAEQLDAPQPLTAAAGEGHVPALPRARGQLLPESKESQMVARRVNFCWLVSAQAPDSRRLHLFMQWP